MDIEFSSRELDVDVYINGDYAGASIDTYFSDEFEDIAADDTDEDSIDKGFHMREEVKWLAVV